MAWNRPTEKIESESKTAKSSRVWWGLGVGLIVAAAAVAGVVSFTAGTSATPEKTAADEEVAAEAAKPKQSRMIREVKSAAASTYNTVTPKLRTCEFLLNKKFKKNAKFYLCLFSASWCPPCRAEMPRIAKTYAEMLKDDPDIELIHFSRDQNDEKALAWAKEHDVKFPVVKPRGGNPLDLRCNGIPHLFIVKHDGTLVEEGHPMRIFNEEKFRELKKGNFVVCAKPQSGKTDVNAAVGEQKEVVGGYTWSFKVENGEATIGGAKPCYPKCAVAPSPTGTLIIPSVLGGAKVTRIGDMAFAGRSGLVSVAIPASVKTIGKHAFAWCERLSNVAVDGVNPNYCDVDGVLYNKAKTELIYWPRDKKPEAGAMSVEIMPSVTCIESWAFLQCKGFSSITIPSGVVRIGEFAFCACEELTSVVLRGERPSAPEKIFRDCEKLKSIHVPANAKSWAGIKGSGATDIVAVI